MAAKPDVVCVWAEASNDGIIEQLETQGIPTLVIIPESAEEMKEAAALLGEVLGLTEQADKVIGYYDDTIAMIKDRLKDVPERKGFIWQGHTVYYPAVAVIFTSII